MSMDISSLSLTDKQADAVRNIMQSLDNAKTYCSYLDKSDLRSELEEMIEKFIHKVEDKINDNY